MVFVRPGDILKIGLLTKTSVVSERFGLNTNMTPLLKGETLTNGLVDFL